MRIAVEKLWNIRIRRAGLGKSGNSGLGKSFSTLMHYEGSQLLSSVTRNSVGLLDSQRVVIFLDHNEWARSHGLDQNLRLQVQDLGILSEGVGEPALEWSVGRLSSCEFPAVLYFVKDFFLDGGPESPKEGFIRPDDWDFETAPDEEPFLIDDVLIGAADRSRITLLPVHVCVHVGRVGRKAQREAFVKPAAA